MLKGSHLIRCLLILLTPLVASANISPQSNAQQPAQMVYELRTYTSHPGKLEALENRFRNHTMALFEKHGIINVSYWKPLEQPNTLIYLVAHPSELEAANNYSIGATQNGRRFMRKPLQRVISSKHPARIYGYDRIFAPVVAAAISNLNPRCRATGRAA